MNSSNKKTLRHIARAACVGGLAAISLSAVSVQAQTASPKWPDKTVRIIAAGPAGGSADIVARLIADSLGKDGGQAVVVDPKPGAAGVLAVNELSHAPHDGYTVLVAVNSLVSEIPHIVKLQKATATEIKPLAELARGGLVLVGTPSVPAKNFGELVTWVKANPGKVNYASYTAGTISHVLGLQLNKAAGLDMTHVAYKGSTPALTDVMGGHVPLMFDAMPSSLPMIKGGKVRAFAVSTAKRSPLLPDVPTFTELGYPQLEATGWMGLWVKPDVPAAQQARIREAALKVLAQPAMRERFQEIGFEVGQPRTSEELSKTLAADYQRMGTVLKSIDFKPE